MIHRSMCFCVSSIHTESRLVRTSRSASTQKTAVSQSLKHSAIFRKVAAKRSLAASEMSAGWTGLLGQILDVFSGCNTDHVGLWSLNLRHQLHWPSFKSKLHALFATEPRSYAPWMLQLFLCRKSLFFLFFFFPEIHRSSPEAAPAAFYKLKVRGGTELEDGEAL